jgi:uncharacterized protein (DUF1501 family)
MTAISRRRFLALTGGLIATGCTSGAGSSAPTSGSTPTPTSGSVPGTTGSLPATTAPATVTTITTPPDVVTDDRVVVMVELAGGNDAVNTLPPLTGAYRDLRPTLALPEAEILMSTALSGHGLHPSLAPLVPYLDGGRLATVAGVGFPDPDRSHFVSTDRWLRADRMDETLGWLGRWLDGLPAELPALGATALGSNGRMLLGADRHGTVIDQVNAFAFPSRLSNASVRALAEPVSDDPLVAAAQQAFTTSVGAVEEFDVIADAVRAEIRDSAPADGRQGGAFTTGLAVAAQLIVGGVGARVITVTGGGFDTHGDQLDIHADLLADLAGGLDAFWRTLDDSGLSERVLLVTHSEFGRRVRENASAGCDHGAAGVSFVMGDALNAGLYGSIDTADLLDGDLRPQIDPRSLFTACLDWLGADVERVLGRRHDEIPLLT